VQVVQAKYPKPGEPLTPYNPELERTLRRAMNAQECEAKRLQQLANAQTRGNKQRAANNENDDVIRNKINEQNIDYLAPRNHRQPQK
ncbi:hypothetical protein HAX54_018289, partial [Datura stramonium]|nr:hypothetical protein [Datura stramonium]